MAIALRAVGARTKVDVGVGGSPQTFALPTGHVSGDLLILVIVTDSVAGPGTPSGWTVLGHSGPTGIFQSAKPYPRVDIFWRIDTGSLGSSVSVTFSTNDYPSGDPYVLGCVMGYTGTHQTSPIVEWSQTFTSATTAAEAHPQLTTNDTGDWLLTVRAASGYNAVTFTDSVGTDVERVDDTDGFNELSFAIYDSNTALAAGLQTQRTTTASGTADFGSSMWSIAIRTPSSATSVFAPADVASAVATAYDTTVSVVQPTTWDACTTGNGAYYQFAVDWLNDGTFTTGGKTVNRNPFMVYGTTDWTATSATVSTATDPAGTSTSVLAITSTAGATPRAQASKAPAVPGNTYRVRGWLYVPVALPSTAAVSINWYDSSGTFVSTSSNTATLTANTWTFFDMSDTPPDTAVQWALVTSMSGTPGAGYVMYAWGLQMIDPSYGTQTAVSPALNDLITSDALSGGISIDYGRDQTRQLSPGKIGTMSLAVNNTDRQYSPENTSSPLTGSLDPARVSSASVTYLGTLYPLFRGRIDDFTVNAIRSNRTVSFSFQDDQATLSGNNISTQLYQAIRTGAAINVILDTVGWSGGRDIDAGATFMPWWWLENTDALTAVNDIVASEGPPSIAYVDPNGTFVFRDRHHRLLRAQSVYSQATFAAAEIDCSVPPATGYSYTDDQFTYQHGWRDIVNSATFSVDQRQADTDYSAIWSTDSIVTITNGETRSIQVSASDPFLDMQDLVGGTDVIWNSGSVSLSQSVSKRSGQSLILNLTATGGTAIITYLQIRARSVPVVSSQIVSFQDSGSISRHGTKTYPNQAPWAGANDAYAIAQLIVSRYAERRPIVTLTVAPKDPAHYVQVLSRTISDRITIVNGEMGMNSDFFVENVTHSIQRTWNNKPPVHMVTFGCEKEPVTAGPQAFTFDVKGAGFDQGVFDPTVPDSPDTVFIFDDPDQGQFDFGKFGT